MAAKEISVKKYVVRLSGEERERLEALIRKGKSPAQRLLKARILLKVDASFSGSTDTRSDVARISAADKNGARIAGLEAGLDLPGPASTKSGPN